MKGKVFVDTNILIYAHDIDADFKAIMCRPYGTRMVCFLSHRDIP